jgi:DNA-binding PadR family transcriptional regulator
LRYIAINTSRKDAIMHHMHREGGHGHHPRCHHQGFSPEKLRAAFESGRFPHHGFGGHRARRGDIRTAILRLLSEKPMHGYQIIQELSERSGGAWSPSPGSVYPTLQMLADEGLISSDELGGKKVFSLTETGTAAVAETADEPAPWEETTTHTEGAQGYREAVMKFGQAALQVGRNGTPEQHKVAIEILNDARKKLYAILAED